jgi:cytidylate kinase
VTFGAAATAKKLTPIGANHITTNDAVTVGTDGTAGTGKLTFTDSKTLTLNGHYAATGDVVVAATKTLTVAGAGARTVSAAITAATANGTESLTFTAGGAGVITLNQNVGTDTNKFNVITLTGANDDLVLGAEI